MMGFGFLFMLLLVAIPLVGIVALVVWLNNANQQGNKLNTNPLSKKREQVESPEMKRFCSHCGAGLQDSWTHCPQCGAGIGS